MQQIELDLILKATEQEQNTVKKHRRAAIIKSAGCDRFWIPLRAYNYMRLNEIAYSVQCSQLVARQTRSYTFSIERANIIELLRNTKLSSPIYKTVQARTRKQAY